MNAPRGIMNPQVDTAPMGRSLHQAQVAPQQLMSGQVARSAIPVEPQGASGAMQQMALQMNSARHAQTQGVEAGTAAALDRGQMRLPTQSERADEILARHRLRAIEAMGGAPNIAAMGGVMKQALAAQQG